MKKKTIKKLQQAGWDLISAGAPAERTIHTRDRSRWATITDVPANYDKAIKRYARNNGLHPLAAIEPFSKML